MLTLIFDLIVRRIYVLRSKYLRMPHILWLTRLNI